jgi:preprotein translocase subunit SecB
MSAADLPSITLSQIFLLSATFSHRGEPLSFLVETPQKPQRINVQFMLRDLNAGEAAQVLIKVASDPTVEEEALYDFAVEVTAIVGKGPDGADAPAPQVLLEIGASLLFPFVREAVANITGRGRFGPVWLNPFNVRAAIQAQQPVVTTQVPLPATS